jgi:predicted dehydrogenase
MTDTIEPTSGSRTDSIRWGILSTAKIATKQVIPALQKGQLTQVLGIASRDGSKASEVAHELGIPRAYGSYEALLADPDIDAVYNPLPNHLHVPWTLKALAAGKHVLCEKPVALNTTEARSLWHAAQSYPDLKVMEAFMYRFHPQWLKAKSLVGAGILGEIRAIHSHFSYYNNDPANIRNKPDIGGGGLMDIGCYCISFPRFLLDQEPSRVVGLIELDPLLQVDRLASGMMDFGGGVAGNGLGGASHAGGVQATFTCSTQMAPYQRVHILGTLAHLEVEIPANPPAWGATRLLLHKEGAPVEEIRLEPSNHYTLQGDAFARAILEHKEVPTPLIDAVRNMAVIEALFRSGKEERWVKV